MTADDATTDALWVVGGGRWPRADARSLFVLLFVVAVFSAGTGCRFTSAEEASRNTNGAITTEEQLGVLAIRAGDCIRNPAEGLVAAGAIETITAVPCDQPHSGEVYAVVPALIGVDGEYPGQSILGDRGLQDCIAKFDQMTGLDFASDPTWDITVIVPTPQSWSAVDDRDILCLAVPFRGGMTTRLLPG